MARTKTRDTSNATLFEIKEEPPRTRNTAIARREPVRASAPAKRKPAGKHGARETARVIPMTDPAQIMDMIERLAGNRDVDPDKLDRLLSLQERLLARNAEIAFNAAFVEMQPHLPIVDKDGRIIVKEKDERTGKRTGEEIQNTQYAKWETIGEAIKPILHEYGFAISHRISATGEKAEKEAGTTSGLRRVTAILRHIDGHVDDSCYFDALCDTSGSKNNIQGWGSGIKYGMRYTGCAALNIITRDMPDDDGKGTGGPAVFGDPLSAEELQKLLEMLDAVGCRALQFLKYMNDNRPKKHPIADKIADLPSSRFDESIKALQGFDANRRQVEADKAAKGKGGQK